MVKEKKFHFSFKVFVRLLIFTLIIYFSINWFSSQKQSVLGDVDITLLDEETKNTFFTNLYKKLPENSRYQIDNFFKNTSAVIQQKLNGFPQKQIKEIKKAVIKNVSDDIIKNIDKD